MLTKIIFLFLNFLILNTVLFADPQLEGEVSVNSSKDAVTIKFKVIEKTDVSVYIIDEKNNIIRHLASGLIGPNIETVAPLQPSLTQELTWDRKDDFGKAVSNPKLSVKVSVGTNVKFKKFIGQDPYIFGVINSMAFDEENNLYLKTFTGGANQNMDSLRIFSPKGKYIKTLIPFSETQPKENLKNIADWNEIRKSYMPTNNRSQLPEFYPWGANSFLISASKKNGLILTCNNSLYKMNSDGGEIQGPFPLWNAEAKLKNPKWNIPQLATSPNGKYLYIANVAGTQYDPKSDTDCDPNWPQGRVYRLDLSNTTKNPEVFYDLTLPNFQENKYWLPNAWNKRTAAYNVTVDKKGNVYICDLVNQEIVEVSPDGKLLSQTKVPWPEKVHIDEHTGDYYAISRQAAPKDGYVPNILYKVKGRGNNSQIVAELKLDKWRGLGSASTIAYDNKEPILWLGGGNDLICFKATDKTFTPIATDFQPKQESQQDWNRLSTDYTRDEVYTSNGTNLLYRYNGETGKGGILKKENKVFHGVDLAVAYDGSLYIRSGEGYSGPLERLTYDLEPLPFPSGTHYLTKYIYSRYGVGNCEKGLGVGPNGEAYINFMYDWNQYFIAGFDDKGKPIQGNFLKGKIKPDLERGGNADLVSAVIGPMPGASGGVKVDLQGNIYVGVRLLPKDFKSITGFEKNIAYNSWTGCIAKFPKNGGTFLDKDQEPQETNVFDTIRGNKIVGAEKIYPGIAPFSGGGYGGGGSSCVCRVPRFDVDRFGRICYTNAVTNSSVIVDNNGNLIAEFGSYGNFDSNNDPEKTNKDVIPLAWPIGAGFTKSHLYILDVYNRRIVQTNYEYNDEVIKEIK